MKKCRFCGCDNDEQAKTCERCKASFPHNEEQDMDNEEPVKVYKKRTRSE